MSSPDPALPHRLDTLLGHQAWLQGLARALVRDPELADDAVQETWLAAVRNRGVVASGKAWLATVVRNRVRQDRRATRRRERRESAVEPTTVEATSDVVERFELRCLVANAVLQLDEPFRSTVLAHHFEGRTLAAIAKETATAEGTVRWRLHRAHELLRGEFETRLGKDRWRAALLPLAWPTARRAGLALFALAGLMTMGGLGFLLVRGTADRGPAATTEALTTRVDAGTAPAPLARAAAEAVDPRDAVETRPQDAGAVWSALFTTRVVNPLGAPVPGAKLSVAALQIGSVEVAPSGTLAANLPTAIADRAGRVDLTLTAPLAFVRGLPGNTPDSGPTGLVLRVEAEGHAATTRIVYVADGDRRTLPDFVLRETSVLTGIVRDANGKPLAGASLAVTPTPFVTDPEALARKGEVPFAAATTTSGSGSEAGQFRIDGVPRGLVMVWARADGRKSTWRTLVVRDREQRVELDLAESADAPAAPPVPDPGKDLDVLVVDAKGRPVRGASIGHLDRARDGRVDSGFRRTLEGGRTRIHVGSPGRGEKLTVLAVGGVAEGYAFLEDVDRTVPELRIELAPFEPCKLVIRDERGVALRGATAVWNSELGDLADLFATTDGDGKALLMAPPLAGKVRCSAPGHVATEVAFPRGGERELEVRLAVQRGIAGRVLRAGRPVEGAFVSLLRAEPRIADGLRTDYSRHGLFDAKSSADGSFRIDLVDRVRVRVLVHGPGLVATYSEERDFDPGIGWTGFAIQVAEGGKIAGRMAHADGAPAQRCVVACNDGIGRARTVLTDLAGRYAFEGLAPGRYEVRPVDACIRPDAHGWSSLEAAAQVQPFHGEVAVEDGRTTEHDLALDGHVLDARISIPRCDLVGWQVKLVRAHDGTCLATDGDLTDGVQLRSWTGQGLLLRLIAPGGTLGSQLIDSPLALEPGRNVREFAYAWEIGVRPHPPTLSRVR